MPKYKVVFKGLVDKTDIGKQAFLDKFAGAYKISPEEAKDRITRSKGILYQYDDPGAADKAKKFLASIGAEAVIEENQEPPPAPPIEDSVASFVGADSKPAAVGGVRACPKCGYQVPIKQDECPSCHVFISKYEQMLARKAQSLAPMSATPAAGGTMYPGPVAQGNTGVSPYVGKITCPEAKQALIYGIVGMFCFGFVLGILAVVKGIGAISSINENPQYSGKIMAIFGIILGVVDFIGWIAAMVTRFGGGM